MNCAVQKVLMTLASFSLFGISACSSSSTSGGSAPRGDVVPEVAPEIEGKVIGDDKLIRLSQFRGKVVLLDFWAPRCKPCIAAIPHEKELFARYQDKPFVLLGISIDGAEDKLGALLKQYGVKWPNILDENNRIGAPYKIEAVPTFVLVDAKGNIAGRWEGAQDLPEIETAIERELAAANK